jgi:Ca-activated chloride channel family protein
MQWIAENGRGRFYEVQNPSMLPQIFMKEAAVILKSAIIENPFKPVLTSSSEPVRGIAPEAYPQLLGYVGSSPKPRAEVPLVSDQGDPIFAHWQYGLGRAAAFTSDARPKWANPWMAWGQYRQFWTQIARWSLRRVENSDFTTEVSVDKGVGSISVEALDAEGSFRNFLDLRAKVVSPTGESQDIRLEQSSPGRYEAKFPAKEMGAYTVNLSEYEAGEIKGMQVIGASVNFSPEYLSSESNMHLLSQMANEGKGIMIDPSNPEDNPYSRDRKRTFQARDLWPWLLMSAILLFPVDVGIRRIQLEPEELKKAWEWIRQHIFFIGSKQKQAKRDEAMEALLSRRDAVRAKRTSNAVPTPRSDLFAAETEEPVILNEELNERALQNQLKLPKLIPEQDQSSDKQQEDNDSMASRLLAAKRKNKPKS